MAKDRYVAYVGTYTHGSSVGIHIFDVDAEKGKMTERKVVPINNPSDLIVSTSGKFLYSIADEGVQSFRILEDGDLEPINSVLGSLGLVLALGKGGIPGIVGDDGGIQATALKDGQSNAVVELLEQLARGLEAQVISGHVAGGERLLDLRHKRLLAAPNRVAQQTIQIDVVAQR